MSVVRFMSFFFLLSFLVLTLGCPSSSKKKSDRRESSSKVKPRSSKSAAIEKQLFSESWLSSGWVELVRNRPDALKPLFDRSKPIFADTLILMKNQLHKANAWKTSPAKLMDLQRIVRGRVHLRMARFYQRSFLATIQLSKGVYQSRLKRAKKLNLGKLFHFYRGRLLCMSGDLQDGLKALKQSLPELPKSYKERVKTWLIACDPDKKEAKQQSSALASLKFEKDPEGWVDWILVHSLFDIPTKRKPDFPSSRAKAYASALLGFNKISAVQNFAEAIDKESIREGEIESEISYYDPAAAKVLMIWHAHRASLMFLAMDRKDLYHPFYLAEAYRILGRSYQKECIRELDRFLQKPPTKVSLSYLLFSAFPNVEALKAFAKVRHIRLTGKSDKVKVGLFKNLLKQDGFTGLYALWGLAELGVDTATAFKQVSVWMDQVEKLEKKIQKRDDTKVKGGGALQSLGLYYYIFRDFYLKAGAIALRAKRASRASSWLERLHQKDEPYLMGERNQAEQMVLTASAYMAMGRLDVATMFFAKNRKKYPTVIQPWSLLRTLRIFRGIGTYNPPKSN